jgi:hypothetical protein
MFLLWQQKYNLQWGFQQLREVWTKDFKSSPPEEDDVEEDDVEMTGKTQGMSLVSMRIRLRKSFVLPMRRARNNTESQQHQDMSNQRSSINWRSG